MGIFRKNYDREGAGKPMPEGGIRRYCTVLATHFWSLIELNLLFVLVSLPIITLPAALCAMNRVCLLYIRDGYCALWHDFWKEFKSSFLRSLLPAVGFTLLLLAGVYVLALGPANAAQPGLFVIFTAAGVSILGFCLCWASYFFAYIPLLDQKNRDVAKNARLMCLVSPGRLFGTLGVLALGAALAMLMAPNSIVLLLVCIPVLVQFTVCFLANDLAETYILTTDAEETL